MNLQADAGDSVSPQIQRAVAAALNDLPLRMRWWVRPVNALAFTGRVTYPARY